MKLPQKLPLDMMQTLWAALINPVLANPANTMSVLSGVVLTNGITVIPHKLGRKQQGWILTDINGAAQIYRSASFNNLTLTLTSNAVVTVNLGVF